MTDKKLFLGVHMKKKSIAAIFMTMALCLSACSGLNLPFVSEEETEDTTEDSPENSIEEGVIVTYRIVDEDPSKKEIKETIQTLIGRIENYSDEYSYDADGDEIVFEIGLDPEKTDVSTMVRKLKRRGGLMILDSENYGLWSRGEDYEVAFTDADVKQASPSEITDVTNSRSYVTEIILTDDGAERFADFTNANLNSSVYIIFDGEAISNPRIMSPILDGHVVITGLNSVDEARNLASDIMAGTLPLEIELVDYEILTED